MIAPSLFADLMSRGVVLTIAETPKEAEVTAGARLRVQAPAGVLNESLRAGINHHRDELLQFVFELQERAAILEFEQGNARERAEDLARSCVTGGLASPDGQLWLDEYARNHPTVKAYFAAFGSLAGEIEVRRGSDGDGARAV